jgi:hypothetical protein
MGTTLTGTTPQDTYDSLIKVTDNGPISGTLKALSDGLGNDSTLSLSTTAASIAGTLAVSGNATFDTNTLFVDAANNRVGIGTVVPAGNLHIASATDGGIRIQGSASGLSYIDLADTASGTPSGSIAYNHIADALTFSTGGSNAERVRITSAGNVGIGTNAPNSFSKLDVDGQILSRSNIVLSANQSYRFNNYYNSPTVTDKVISTGFAGGVDFDTTTGSLLFRTSNASVSAGADVTLANRVKIDADGLKFGADTAAANALDDYEEGTWAPTIIGGTSGTATYSGSEGHYTKIGRQVVVTWFITFQKNTIVGDVTLSSFPFNIGNLGNNYPQAAILMDNLATPYTNPILQLNNSSASALVLINNGAITNHSAMQGTQLGAGNMAFRGTATYFV